MRELSALRNECGELRSSEQSYADKVSCLEAAAPQDNVEQTVTDSQPERVSIRGQLEAAESDVPSLQAGSNCIETEIGELRSSSVRCDETLVPLLEKLQGMTLQRDALQQQLTESLAVSDPGRHAA